MLVQRGAARRMETGDVRLRRWAGVQWLRRLSLLVATVLPAWFTVMHARANAWDARHAQDAERFPLHGLPWTVDLLGLEVMDPLAALGVLVAGTGDLPRVLLATLPALLLVVLLGRFYCGWLCPYAAILSAANALRALLVRLGLHPRELELPARTPHVVLVLVLALTALSGTQVAGLIYPPLLVHREIQKALLMGGLGGGAVLLGVLFLLDATTWRAGWCTYLCPGGVLFRVLGRRSPVRVQRTPSLCTDCTACDAVCNFRQSPMTDRHDDACERCTRCIASCPTGALTLVKIGRRADGEHHG